jgi:AcrR family transcriptional regulator
MPRRVGRPGLSRDDVVRAALFVIERHGVATFTVKAVARAAKVTEPAIFHHFPTKDALVGAVASEITRQEVEHVLAAVGHARGAKEALTRMLRAYVAFYRSSFAKFRAHYILPQIAAMSQESLERGVYPLASALLGTLEAAILRDQEAGIASRELHARRAANIVWTLALGLGFRGALLDASGARTTHSLDDMIAEACKMLELMLRPA